MNNITIASSILTVNNDIDVSNDLNSPQLKSLAKLINEEEEKNENPTPQTSG